MTLAGFFRVIGGGTFGACVSTAVSTPVTSGKMKRVTDTTEVLGTVETPHGSREVCASADAQYDEDAIRLVVKLDAFLRTTDLLTKEKRFPAEWLPKPETVRETVGPDETVEMAHDIFHRWVRKVRLATPTLANR